jgi:hypothetical protein
VKRREQKDVGRDGFEAGAAGIERELGRLATVPVPPGLRERVLAVAGEARRGAVLSPGLRRLAVACSLVIAGVAVAGPFAGRHEALRLAAVLDGEPAVAAAESPAPELAEVLAGDEKGMKKLSALRALAASAARARRPRPLTEARDRLKGWMNDETLESPD